MLSPIIKEPVFECAGHIRICSVDAGCTIIVRSGNNKIGEGKAKGGSVIVKLKNPCSPGDTITAVAVKNSKKSNPSAPVKVQKLPPLKPPLTEKTLYEGSTCIHAWGFVPGSSIRAWNGTELLGRGIAYDSAIRLPLSRPLMSGDAAQLETEICGSKSAKTAPIVPTKPFGSGPYAEKLPPPTVKKLLFACQRVVGLKGLLPGARIEIFADKNTVYKECAPTVEANFLLGPKLQETQLVTAQQIFDSLNLKSDLSDSVRVESPKNLTAPMIHEPVFEGERSVFVFNLSNSVKVEIAVDGLSIGVAEYDGYYEFDIGYELKARQKIMARQGLCGMWSPWSKEATVKPLPEEVLPPKIEEPLYPCANMVRIHDKVEGSLVKVYADGIFVGKEKLSVVRVVPYLVAKQKVTATQTVGSTTSKSSKPVVVKDLPQDLPAPKLEEPVDSCDPYVTVLNLLPGARVNIFWHKLLIGTAEALDKVALISVAPQPWPGTKIHANQNMCMLKSADSKVVDAIGYIMARAIGRRGIGQLIIAKKDSIRVETKCPVNVDTKVILSSVKKPGYSGPLAQWENPGVISIQGSGESVIPKGKSHTDFMIVPVKQGFSWLKVTAGHYTQVEESWGVDLLWKYPGLERVNVYTGTKPKLDPEKMEITEGASFKLKFTLDPVPWAACKASLKPMPSDSPLHGHLVIQPSEVVIPAGQKSGTVTIKTLKKGPAEGKLYVYPNYYWGSACHITIKKVAPPPPKKPTVTTQPPHKLGPLTWKAPSPKGYLYVQGYMLPVANGKLKKVRNINTTWPWRYNLWFPKYPHTTNDAFDPKKGHLLKYGEEATPSQLGLPESMNNGVPIAATVGFVDSYQKGPVYVELHYEIQKP